jgi:hypothetical protein
MNEFQAESQQDRDAEERHIEEGTQHPKFKLMELVRTLEGYVGHVTGYDEGYLNIKVAFRNHSLWYSDVELTSV